MTKAQCKAIRVSTDSMRQIKMSVVQNSWWCRGLGSASLGLPSGLEILSDLLRLDIVDSGNSSTDLIIPFCTCPSLSESPKGKTNLQDSNPCTCWVQDSTGWHAMPYSEKLGNNGIEIKVELQEMSLLVVTQQYVPSRSRRARYFDMKLTALRLWNPCLATADLPMYLLLVEPVKARPCCGKEGKSARQNLWDTADAPYQFCSEVTLSASLGQQLEVVSQSNAPSNHTLANFFVGKAVKVVPISSMLRHLTTVFIASVNEKGSRNLVNVLEFRGAFHSNNLPPKCIDMPTVTNGNSPHHDVMAMNLVHSSDPNAYTDLRGNTQSHFGDHVEDNLLPKCLSDTHFLKSLNTKIFVADALSLARGQLVIFVRFKKISPRGFEEEAACACSMVIKDFLGCIVAEEGVLSAFARWARTRLVRQADRSTFLSSSKVQILSVDEVTSKFHDSNHLDIDSMQLAAIGLFHQAHLYASGVYQTKASSSPIWPTIPRVIVPPLRLDNVSPLTSTQTEEDECATPVCMPAAEKAHNQQEVRTHSINSAYEDQSSNDEAMCIESKLAELSNLYASNVIVKNTFIEICEEDTSDAEQPVITRSQTAPTRIPSL